MLHAQINLRDDLFRGVGSCQRCKCSGNSPWCSGRCRGWWSSSRPGRCRCGRFCGSGYRHGRRDSWSSTDYSCSRCEDVHRFWPHNHGTKNSRGEEVREVSTLRDLICLNLSANKGSWCRSWAELASDDPQASSGRSRLRHRQGPIHLSPLLGFQRKPGPRPCHVEQNISHSRVGSMFRHLLALGGAVPAFFHSEHGKYPKDPSHFQKKTPPRPGGPAGFIAWQVWGFGASAKLAYQSKTELNVPKNFQFYSLRNSRVTFNLRSAELPRVDSHRDKPMPVALS